MKWLESFDRQAGPYLAHPQTAEMTQKLRAFLLTVTPEKIIPPAVFGDSESMDVQWHYRSDTLNVCVEISIEPDGGDIYVWDQKNNATSIMGDITDPAYIKIAKKHLDDIELDYEMSKF